MSGKTRRKKPEKKGKKALRSENSRNRITQGKNKKKHKKD